jgi:hypothetical protein
MKQIIPMPALLVLIYWSSATSVAGAATTVYTDRAAWVDALGRQFLTEDFADAQLNDGVSFVSSESGRINPAQQYYQDVLASTSQNEPMTVWSFTPAITAFGANFTLGGPGGSGNSLLVYSDDTTFVGAIPSSYAGGFWGFISDASLGSVKLIGGSGTNQQTYNMDNMVYAPVPVPAAVWLFGSALGLLGWLTRRTAGTEEALNRPGFLLHRRWPLPGENCLRAALDA